MGSQNSRKKAAQEASERIRKNRLQQQSPQDALEEIRSGNRAALGRAITLLESSKSSDRNWAQELLQLALPYSGNSIRLGITGVPGVGKSTFIESLGIQLIDDGNKLAVLAIDPSSQKSKGSILGDKTRMEKLSAREEAFIRPSPTAEALGGVARKTREAIILCEAAGYNIILIETVGVGQSEIAVHSMVDCFLLLMLAGAGDELQGIKRGIMEMADIMAITKADGDNIKASNSARRSYANALHLFPPADHGWIPQVLTCSSYTNEGISELWSTVQKFMEHMKIKGEFIAKRENQDLNWFRETVREFVLEQFYTNPNIAQRLPEIEEQIKKGEITPFQAAGLLFDKSK